MADISAMGPKELIKLQSKIYFEQKLDSRLCWSTENRTFIVESHILQHLQHFGGESSSPVQWLHTPLL